MSPLSDAVILGLIQEARREARIAIRKREALRELADKYWDHPGLFARDLFRWEEEGLADYQFEILEAIPTQGLVAVRGPHGLGKTALAALAVLWFAVTRDGKDWKIIMTASVWRQLEKYLLPEIRKWVYRAKHPAISRIDVRGGFRLLTGEASAASCYNPEYVEGAHADHMFYIFDEAKTIQPKMWESAEGAMTGSGIKGKSAFWLSISTPGETNGVFYDIHRRKPGYDRWWVRHVKIEEVIRAGRASIEWVDRVKKQWGEESAAFKTRVLGEFASSDSDGIIPLSWVELANEHWHELNDQAGEEPWGEFFGVGVDVAWEGEDKTSLALRWDGLYRAIREIRVFAKEDPMVTAGRVKAILDAKGGRSIIDTIGLGAGTYARLLEQHCAAISFKASERPDAWIKDRSGEFGFVNRRAHGWWSLREAMDPGYESNIALCPDDELTGELTAMKWKPSGGNIDVSSKKEIRKILGRSTDRGDSVMQVFYPGNVKRRPRVFTAK